MSALNVMIILTHVRQKHCTFQLSVFSRLFVKSLRFCIGGLYVTWLGSDKTLAFDKKNEILDSLRKKVALNEIPS